MLAKGNCKILQAWYQLILTISSQRKTRSNRIELSRSVTFNSALISLNQSGTFSFCSIKANLVHPSIQQFTLIAREKSLEIQHFYWGWKIRGVDICPLWCPRPLGRVTVKFSMWLPGRPQRLDFGLNYAPKQRKWKTSVLQLTAEFRHLELPMGQEILVLMHLLSLFAL